MTLFPGHVPTSAIAACEDKADDLRAALRRFADVSSPMNACDAVRSQIECLERAAAILGTADRFDPTI